MMKTLELSRATMSVYSVALCASLCLSGQLAAGNKPAAHHRDEPFRQPVGAVTGLWATQSHALAPSPWKACWIWEDAAVQQNMNRMVLARKRFVLDDAPRNARLHITADSSYQLYVNGVFVLRGPARCAPHHQSFDVVDVAKLLKPGANVLAVRVHHTGLARSYHQPSRPGLLVQLEIASDQSTRTIRTDTTWKMLPDPRWDTGSPRINRWHAGYVDIFESELFWIMGWHDYALYSGDLPFVRRLLPTARRIMDRVAELTNSDGLIDAPPYPYWIDHSFIDRRGANFVLNAFYVLALDNHAETLAWLSEDGEEDYRRQAAELRKVLREKFWNKKRRLFTDAIIEGQQSSRFTEHANCIALAADIASPEQVRMVVPVLLKKDSDLVPVTSLFMHWMFTGLCKTRHVDDALAMLQTRFEHMLVEGSGTLWEAWHLDRTRMNGREQKMTWTDAQGECGFVPMALARWIGGLEVVAPGAREVIVRQVPCKLRHLSAVLPSPLGELHVAWRRDTGAVELEIEVPTGMLVKLDLASVAGPGHSTLLLDGERQDFSGTRTGLYIIPQGRHRLRFPRNDENKTP